MTFRYFPTSLLQGDKLVGQDQTVKRGIETLIKISLATFNPFDVEQYLNYRKSTKSTDAYNLSTVPPHSVLDIALSELTTPEDQIIQSTVEDKTSVQRLENPQEISGLEKM